MYKGIINGPVTIVENRPIEFTTKVNTNAKTIPRTNGVEIASPGIWDVYLNLVVTGIPAQITAQIYADGAAIPEAVAAVVPAASTDVVSLNITDALRIVRTFIPTTATIDVKINEPVTINAGALIIEERK